MRETTCCFTGHRPKKLQKSEKEVVAALERAVDAAVSDGYTTFISGMAQGVDIWAAECVLRRRQTGVPLRLLCAVPYTAGFDPKTGKQKRKSVYGKTKGEVREKLSKILVDIDEGTYIDPCRMPLSEWMEIWLKEYTFDKKWSTVKQYKAQVYTHLLPELGRIPLAALNPHTIQTFCNNLYRGSITEKPLSAKSVRNVHGVLRKALAIAVNLGYLRNNPAATITLPRVEKKEIIPLTDEQVHDLLQTVEDDCYGYLLRVMVFTGMRLGETLGLTWDCVDFQKHRLHIYRQLQKRPLKDGGFMFAPLKNDKGCVVAIPDYVENTLHQWQMRQLEERFRAGADWVGWQSAKERESYFIFTDTMGAHLHPQTTYNHFKKIAAAIGAPDARVHDLRHTYAVLSLQNGDDVKTVQNNMGHATAAFTLDVYGHVSEKMKDASADRMQQYIQNL